MIGYDQFKHQQNLEAWRDRQVIKEGCSAETRRLAFVAKLHRTFPFLNVKAIAETVVPWNLEKFKKRLAAAQARYLKSRSDES